MNLEGPPSGTLIGDVYRVSGALGKGAMGVVLLGRDETLDRRVAIKFLNPDLLNDSFRGRFRDEALAMARVSHPNVVQIHALGEHDKVPYFVMEYVEGVTLEDWRKSSAPVPIDKAIRILEETCRGLTAIHAANTVHRDIKPSNILLDARLMPKIADLGLAVIRNDPRVKPEIVGTPAFMAPEIGFQRVVDPAHASRSDVYSLACVAYELLTGQQPFTAPNGMTMIVQHGHVVAPAPSSIRPELGPDIDYAIARAMAKDPADRTPTAEAFRRDLTAGTERAREPVRILIAEDNDDFRALMEFRLAAEFPDAEVVAFADGNSALASFDERTPSVVLLDLQMPGLDGMELTTLIRSRRTSVRVPILVLTASGGPADWQRLSMLGADRFLVKPVVFEDVVALVRRSLHERATLPPRVEPVTERPPARAL